MDSKSSRFMDDKESLQAIVDGLRQPTKGMYLSYKALALESAFPGRKMIIYTLDRSIPTNITTITFGTLVATPEDGPMVDVEGGGQSYVLTVHPCKWGDRDLFLQIPQNFIFKWKGKFLANGAVQFAPHYAVLVKTKSAEHLQVEGHTYCVSLNKFRERFPGIPTRY